MQDCLSTQSVERGHEDCIEDFISELITEQVSSHGWLYSGGIQYESQPCH
jgi:hypothetical protein